MSFAAPPISGVSDSFTTFTSDILPPDITTSTSISPLKPFALPLYVPSSGISSFSCGCSDSVLVSVPFSVSEGVSTIFSSGTCLSVQATNVSINNNANKIDKYFFISSPLYGFSIFIVSYFSFYYLLNNSFTSSMLNTLP